MQRLFVGEAVGRVVPIYSSHRAERASIILSTSYFISPQVAQVFWYVDEGHVTLDAAVEASDHVDGVALGVGVRHGVSVRRWRRVADYLHVLGHQPDPQVARVLVRYQGVCGVVRILTTPEDYHVLVGGDCRVEESSLRL